jgi:hypothetical protein
MRLPDDGVAAPAKLRIKDPRAERPQFVCHCASPVELTIAGAARKRNICSSRVAGQRGNPCDSEQPSQMPFYLGFGNDSCILGPFAARRRLARAVKPLD